MVNLLPIEKPWSGGTVSTRSASDPARRFKAALTTAVREPEPWHEERVPHDVSSDAWPDTPTPAEAESVVMRDVRDLWDELVLTWQAGRRLSSAHWRLCLRLNEEAFAQTTLELICVSGELTVRLRTVSETVYARLLDQMPALNERLQRHAGGAQAMLMRVTVEELEA